MPSSQSSIAGTLTDSERAEMKITLLDAFKKTSRMLEDRNWGQAEYVAQLALALVALDENARAAAQAPSLSSK